MINIQDLQEEHRLWSQKNFGRKPNGLRHHLMGLVEESGELFHAMLKKEQGIRGTPEQHDAKARDAIGDIVIYALGVGTRMSIDWNRQLHANAFYDLQKYHVIRYPNPLSKIATFAALAFDSFENNSGYDITPCTTRLLEALADFCEQRNWSMQDIVQETWCEVSQRDWTVNAETGAAT